MIHRTVKIGKNVLIGHGVVIDSGVEIEDDVQIWHNSVIRSDVRLGKGVVIGHLVVLERFTNVGDHTTIQTQCYSPGFTNIGKYCFFGPRVTMLNEKRISKFRNHVMPQILEGPTIGDYCRIGGCSLIMPGVKIGDNAMIGAGSVITKDVGAHEIWYGICAEKKGLVPTDELIINKNG